MKQSLYIILSALFLILASCGYEEPSIAPNKPSEEIAEPTHSYDETLMTSLVGKWHYDSGEINIGLGADFEHEVLDRVFDFKSSKNFNETYIICQNKHNATFSDQSAIGNWNISDSKLYLNDWDGNPIPPITILELQNNCLRLQSEDGQVATYIRCGFEFNNLKTDILGFWYEFTESQYVGFTQFKEDGFMRTRTYLMINIPGESKSTWKLEGTKLTITSYPVQSYKDTYEVRCCNSQYLIYGKTYLRRQK